MNHNYAAEF